MYCPHCGQQQVNGIIRFCSRCGFPLDGVIQLLSNGGTLPVYRGEEEGTPQISPRRRGVKQGGLLFLSGAVIVPILGVMSSFARTSTFLDILVAFAAIICFIGGPLRMLYAAIFEEGAPKPLTHAPARPFVSGPMPAPQFGAINQRASLPPQPAQPPTGWRRPITAELTTPPSVTENTTRLLDKDERTDR